MASFSSIPMDIKSHINFYLGPTALSKLSITSKECYTRLKNCKELDCETFNISKHNQPFCELVALQAITDGILRNPTVFDGYLFSRNKTDDVMLLVEANQDEQHFVNVSLGFQWVHVTSEKKKKPVKFKPNGAILFNLLIDNAEVRDIGDIEQLTQIQNHIGDIEQLTQIQNQGLSPWVVNIIENLFQGKKEPPVELKSWQLEQPQIHISKSQYEQNDYSNENPNENPKEEKKTLMDGTRYDQAFWITNKKTSVAELLRLFLVLLLQRLKVFNHLSLLLPNQSKDDENQIMKGIRVLRNNDILNHFYRVTRFGGSLTSERKFDMIFTDFLKTENET